MMPSSSSEEKTPEIECISGSIVPISKLTANYPLIPREELVLREQLGAGTYGSVFKGIWHVKGAVKPLVIALKKVFMLEREVDILSQVRHRNIIQFFGVSPANPDFYIVTEYAENGSLFEYLHNANAELTCARILKWARQIAQGVVYLHYEAPTTIIHRDLKSKNVVLGKKMACKICDFGTSKDLTHSHTAPTWGGTAAWMSPEIINQREGITTSTDVWSYGVLLWELFSREIPYKSLTDFKIYSITSQEGSKLVVPDSCPKRLSELLKRCWFKDPKTRIDMREIVSTLEAITEDKQVQSECAHFVKQKEEWHQKIQEQLVKLNALELDYERKKEELKRWEQILRRRESSHRNFLHIIEIMNNTNVKDWDADCVCEWVQYMAAGKEINELVLDKIIERVLQHEICGSRLLQVTERDLENLGIEPVEVRRYIFEKVGELKLLSVTKGPTTLSGIHPVSPPPPTSHLHDDFLNFPSLQMSAELEARNKKQNKNKSPFEQSIVLIVGFYCRKISDGYGRQRYRFKVFLDSDWDSEQKAMTDIPKELTDSATVVKDVNISMTSGVENTVLLDSVRCVCPPFGYLEWTEVDAEVPPTIHVMLAVTYTDQIIQPRNTRMTIEITDFLDLLQRTHTRTVPLKIRAMPTNTSLSRINSSLFSHNHSQSEKAIIGSLQGVWRARRRSIDEYMPDKLHSPTSGIIPAWSDIPSLQQHYQQRSARSKTGTSTNSLKITDNSQKTEDTAAKQVKTTKISEAQRRLALLKNVRSSSALPAPLKPLQNRVNSPLSIVLNNNFRPHGYSVSELPVAREKFLRKRQRMRQQSGILEPHRHLQPQPPQPPQQPQQQQRQRQMPGSQPRIRHRAISETECVKADTIQSPSENEHINERPKFYVCDDMEPTSNNYGPEKMKQWRKKSSSDSVYASFGNVNHVVSNDKRNGSANKAKNQYLKINMKKVSDSSCTDVNLFEKQHLDNGDGKSSVSEETHSNAEPDNNNENNVTQCPCRLRNVLPAPVCVEEEETPTLNDNLDELFPERKCRRNRGSRKGKQFTINKDNDSTENLQTIEQSTTNINKKTETKQKAAIVDKCLSQQNTISQHVYGGYDKWRWKT